MTMLQKGINILNIEGKIWKFHSKRLWYTTDVYMSHYNIIRRITAKQARGIK